MFKFLFFACLVAFVSAKPGLVAPLAYSSPVLSTYGALPAISTYGAAIPAYSTYGAALPAYSTYGAVSAYNPLVKSVVAPQLIAPQLVSSRLVAAPVLKSVVSAPLVNTYSAGLPLAYSKYY